jgi:cyclohexanecarboxylate-CoA ligase
MRWKLMTDSGLQSRYRDDNHWRDETVLERFAKAASERGDQLAIVDYRSDGSRYAISYARLDEARRHWAALFHRLGVRAGDVVSFQLPNWWEFAGLYLACETIAAVANPLMPIFRSRELATMLNMAESRVLITPAVYRGFDYRPMAQDLRAEVGSLEHVLTVDDLHDLTVAEEGAPIPVVDAGADRIVELLYTSGTTGTPKGVTHTGNTLFAALRPIIETLKLTADDVVFMGSPLGHQTGFLYGMVLPLVLGGSAVFQDVWDAERAVEIMARERATFTMASTPFLSDLANPQVIADHDLSAFRVFICGGAPIPRPLVQRGEELLGAKILSLWGMTEFGVVTLVRLDDSPMKASSTDGAPLPSLAVRVVDDEGQAVPSGVDGHLQAKGPSCTVGYLNRPDLYQVDKEGWFWTGDLAALDADGYIRISGRSKDIIIRGGENVPVVEVEMLLARHPAVRDVAIVGMPDPRLGERGCAFLVLQPGSTFGLDAMRAFLAAEGMAKNYWPEHVEVLGELPRTPSGKVQKFLLRDAAAKVEAPAFAEFVG